jgi:hypothetical protein
VGVNASPVQFRICLTPQERGTLRIRQNHWFKFTDA